MSCRKFRDNAIRHQLYVRAYNLANPMRTPALPKEVEHGSRTTQRANLVKIGAKVVRQGCDVTLPTDRGDRNERPIPENSVLDR